MTKWLIRWFVSSMIFGVIFGGLNWRRHADTETGPA